MNSILSLVLFYSSIYHVDPLLTLSVIQVESSFKVDSVSPKGAVGLMQLMPKYFTTKRITRQMLFDPQTNIRLGVRELARLKRACKHTKDNTFLVCYNLGVRAGNRIRYPKLFPYYKQITQAYEELK